MIRSLVHDSPPTPGSSCMTGRYATRPARSCMTGLAIIVLYDPKMEEVAFREVLGTAERGAAVIAGNGGRGRCCGVFAASETMEALG